MVDKTRLQSIQSTLDQLLERAKVIEDNVSKIDVIEKTSNKLERSVQDINDSLIILKENIIQNLLDENKRLNEKIKNVETVNHILSEKVNAIEINTAKIDQYDRRNNIELHGVPSDVTDDKLELKVIEICNSIEADIEPIGIEACHRFGRNDPKKVIVRCVNRKDVEKIKEKKRKLRQVDMSKIGFENTTKIYIQDNLSPYFSKLAWKCRKLKKASKINDWWFKNELIFLRRTENEAPKKISHNDDIDNLYPDFDYSG